MQVRTTMRFPCTIWKWFLKKKSDSTKHWRELKFLYYRWVKMVKPLWKIVCHFLSDFYREEWKYIYVHTNTAKTFIATLFVISQNWRQPYCPSLGDGQAHWGLFIHAMAWSLVWNVLNNLYESQSTYAERGSLTKRKHVTCFHYMRV